MQIRFARPENRTLSIVVTGTGRSGTGFAARWLSSIGLPSGHESFFDHRGLEHALLMLASRYHHYVGECSWEAAPFLSSAPLRDAFVVHQVRHPKKVAESCLRVPPSWSPHYAEYMERHLPLMRDYESTLDKAICRWIYWNQMIEQAVRSRVSHFWRIEDGTDGLLEWLDKQGLVEAEKINPVRMFSNTRHNHKHGPERIARLDDIHPSLVQPLQDQMRRYGYEGWT